MQKVKEYIIVVGSRAGPFRRCFSYRHFKILLNICLHVWICSLYASLFNVVISQAEVILNQLKELKSKIEGSYFTFQPIVLDKQQATVLKHSVVAFTPKTITEQAKYRIVDQLLRLFEGQVRKVLYACLLTCPWFAAVQDEVSGKAKNNILFVVYVARDEQFFSLATQHEKELCEVCEEVGST